MWGRTASCGGSLSRLSKLDKLDQAAWEAAAGWAPAPQTSPRSKPWESFAVARHRGGHVVIGDFLLQRPDSL